MLPLSASPPVINDTQESPFVDGNTMAVICYQEKMPLNATGIQHNFFCIKEVYEADVDLEDKIRKHELIAINTCAGKIRCIYVGSRLNTSQIERIMLLSYRAIFRTVLPSVDFLVQDESTYNLMAEEARSVKDSTLTPKVIHQFYTDAKPFMKKSERSCNCQIL